MLTKVLVSLPHPRWSTIISIGSKLALVVLQERNFDLFEHSFYFESPTQRHILLVSSQTFRTTSALSLSNCYLTSTFFNYCGSVGDIDLFNLLICLLSSGRRGSRETSGTHLLKVITAMNYYVWKEFSRGSS